MNTARTTGYRYKIGELVQFRAGARGHAPHGAYQIIQRMPIQSDKCRYLIRSMEEDYEQIADEGDLGKI